jgi:nicotinate-nucleotide adenylyltransferase
MASTRIGAYGGTFDPIHSGHIAVASAVRDRFDLDELLIIPAASPPHKDPRGLSSSHHRFAMAAIGTLHIPRVRVSALEIDSPANPYTFETVARLRAEYGPQAELYFVVGSDSFEEMHTWKRPDLILAGCNLIVAARPGYALSKDMLGGWARVAGEPGPTDQTYTDRTCDDGSSAGLDRPARIIDLTGDRKGVAASVESRSAGLIFLTDYIRVDVSSTEIRRRAARNLDILGMVPETVAGYIGKYELYKGGQPAGIE